MTAQRYRKKPVEVEAIQWTPANTADVERFVGLTAPRSAFHSGPRCAFLGYGIAIPRLWVEKSKRWCLVEHGTWIIREPDNSGFYPCSAADFEATYEPVEEPS